MRKPILVKAIIAVATWLLCTIVSNPSMADINTKADPKKETKKKEPWQLAEETEVWAPVPATVTTPANSAPSDATMIFDGKNLIQWKGAEGDEAKWDIRNNTLVVKPNTGSIKTKESFCDVQLHIEWMVPTKITVANGNVLKGQERGNSGIFLQEKYEVQILDSYQNETYSNGQAGSIYKQTSPLVNPSRAPGEWQTYDIIFSAPRFAPTGKLTKPAYMTVLHNGVLIQNNVELKGATEWSGKPTYKAHGCAPLLLQDHGNPVSFRNIWIRKL